MKKVKQSSPAIEKVIMKRLKTTEEAGDLLQKKFLTGAYPGYASEKN